MNKTKIEWTDYTWNPIKGLCPVRCWFCYARAMYKRFKRDEKLFYMIEDAWGESQFKKLKPSKIFICSTIELFHPKIKPHWRDQVFREIENNPQHTFQILTKLPENIDRPMPENVWLGVSVPYPTMEHERVFDLLQIKAKIRFISIEPLLEEYFHGLIPIADLDWVIVGRLTGYGNKYNPDIESIERIIGDCRIAGVPLFLKDNLRPIMGDKIINQHQEFPL